jgi:hypothetical protein
MTSSLDTVTVAETKYKPRPAVVPFFKGRRDILDKLEKVHLSKGLLPPNLPTISVLTGLGGSGKTQIALKFAQEYERWQV